MATTCVDGTCKETTFPTTYMDYPGGVESFDAYHVILFLSLASLGASRAGCAARPARSAPTPLSPVLRQPSVPPALTARACQGPITSTYSEVWWTGWENALPKDVVQRFDGKTIAIVGIEMDQVMKTPDGDVSVPINIACGHHSLPLPRSLALSSRVVSQRVHAQTTTITAPVS